VYNPLNVHQCLLSGIEPDGTCVVHAEHGVVAAGGDHGGGLCEALCGAGVDVSQPHPLEVVRVDFVQLFVFGHGEVRERHGGGGDDVGYAEAEHDPVGG